MPGELQYGLAKIFGLDGTTLTGVVSFTLESLGFEKTSDYEELKGQNGDVETSIASNLSQTVDVQFAPNGATKTAAIASLGTLTALNIGAQVVISACPGCPAAAATYNIQPGIRVNLSRDGVVTANFTAKKGPVALALAS
mgnify:CR=1 FL=1